MKIALVIKNFTLKKGGVERYAVNLATALAKEGHEVHVFSGDRGNSVGIGIQFHPISMRHGPNFLKSLRFHLNCQRKLQDNDYDVVHALTQTYPVDIYRMSDGLHCHRMSLLYPNYVYRILRYFLRPMLLLNIIFEKKIINDGGCQLLVANSNLSCQPLTSYYHFPSDRLVVIYNGVELDRFNPRAKTFRPEIRKTYNITENAPLLLFASMDFSRKGLGELIRSLPAVRDLYPSIRLMVIGKGNEKPYRILGRSLGVEEQLIFVGHVENMAPFYGAADLFVLPTHYDPFANVCLEAMACGLPVVTTRQNGATELIQEGVNGYSIEKAGQITDLAEKITLSLSNHSRMGEKAAETAVSFSQADHVQRVLEVYHRIASKKILTETTSNNPFMIQNQAFRSILKKNKLLSYEQIISYDAGIILKRIMARTITKLALKDGEGMVHTFYLKRHQSSRPISSIIKRWKSSSEGRREWANILAFHRAGVPTMVPVAAGERRSFLSEESFLLTLNLEGYEPLEQWTPTHLSLPENRERFMLKRELIRKTALLTRSMHDAGFYHRDFYLTHILLRQMREGIDLRIIDLQRVIRYPCLKRRWRVKDLASLSYSSPGEVFTGKDRLLYLKFYLGVIKFSEADRRLIKIIQRKTGRIDKHTVRMYQKREERKRLGLLER